jgi:DNA-binding CsgD family transcriptional regulator
VARARAVLEPAADGSARTVVVTGRLGVGKTWLLDRLVDELGASMTALRARGHPAEESVPYATLHQLLLPAMDEVGAIGEPRRRAVEQALRLRDGPEPDALAVAAGVLDLVALLSTSGPLLLAVDDVDHADASTRQVLSFLCHRLDRDPVAVVVTTDVDDQPVGERAERIVLEPLAPADAVDLIRLRHPDLTNQAIDRVVTQSAGLPLALVELADALSVDQRAGRAPLPDVVAPPSLAALYRPRIGALTDDERLATCIAALGGLDPHELGQAIAAAGLQLADLASAEVTGLISITPTDVAVEHPALQAVLLDALSYSARRRAVDAVLAALPVGSPRSARLLATLTAGPDDVVAAALESAAAEAAARGGLAEAARTWCDAFERSTTEADRRRRGARAVDALVSVGATRSASTIARALLAETTAGSLRRRLLLRLAEAAASHDEGPDADLLDAAWRAFDGSTRSVETIATLVAGEIARGDFRNANALADELVERVSGPLPPTIAVLVDLAATMAGRPGSGSLLLSRWSDELTDDELLATGLLRVPALSAMAWAGMADEALSIADRALAASSGAPPTALLLRRSERVVVLGVLGRWTEALAEVGPMLDISASMDLHVRLGFLHRFRAYLHASRGDLEAMEADLAAAPRGGAITPVHEGAARGLLELGLGRPELAVTAFESALDAAGACGLVEPSFFPIFPDHVEALWLLGREGEARTAVDDYERGTQVLARPIGAALAARCQALLAPATDMDATFERSRSLHHGLDPFQEARTDLAWGRRLRRERRKVDARLPLARARDVFERLGAVPWARIADGELEACGVASTATPPDRLQTLTPREREVVLAVAEGLTNAEVAARLYISRRTAEYHLANAFAKLGVTRRSQLAEL